MGDMFSRRMVAVALFNILIAREKLKLAKILLLTPCMSLKYAA